MQSSEVLVDAEQDRAATEQPLGDRGGLRRAVMRLALEAGAVRHALDGDRLLDRAGHAEVGRQLLVVGGGRDAGVGRLGLGERLLEARRGDRVQARSDLAQALDVRADDLARADPARADRRGQLEPGALRERGEWRRGFRESRGHCGASSVQTPPSAQPPSSGASQVEVIVPWRSRLILNSVPEAEVTPTS